MRNHSWKLSAALVVAFLATLGLVAAQTGDQPPRITPEQMAEMETYMKAGTPGPPHEALAATAGSYDCVVKSWVEPGGEAMESTATVTRTMSLGGRVLVEEFQGNMMGMPFTGSGMMGFDNVSGKYWSIWTDSMSTGVMVSEGTCDASGRTCTFTGSWNDPVKNAPVTARMTSRWPGLTTQIFEMYGPDPDGEEMKMMEITYHKK